MGRLQERCFTILRYYAVDGEGNIYVTEPFENGLIRKINATTVTTFAGGTATKAIDRITIGPDSVIKDGPVSIARFYLPYGITIDKNNNIYITDYTHVGKVSL